MEVTLLQITKKLKYILQQTCLETNLFENMLFFQFDNRKGNALLSLLGTRKHQSRRRAILEWTVDDNLSQHDVKS